MKKIWELEYEVYKILKGFYSRYVNNETSITLNELVEYGFNGIYEIDNGYIGYDKEDFTKEQLNKEVIIISVDKDSEDFTIVYIEFKE